MNTVDFGNRIKARREYLGLTQADLGEKLGVTPTAITQYEKGRREIGAIDVGRLAEILSVPVAYFYGDDDVRRTRPIPRCRPPPVRVATLHHKALATLERTPIMDTIAQPHELDFQLAQRAYNHTSHTPERRAEHDQKDFANDVNGFYAEMLALCTNDAQKSLLQEEIQRYKSGYLRYYGEYLASHSRVASAFITGPANFPTRTNEKRSNAADKKLNTFLAWRKKARTAIRKRITAPPAVPKEGATLENQVLHEGEGFQILLNHALNRVQIYFDAIPDAELRTQLKGAGWKWSPSQGTWQRQLTEAAKWSAKSILGVV